MDGQTGEGTCMTSLANAAGNSNVRLLHSPDVGDANLSAELAEHLVLDSVHLLLELLKSHSTLRHPRVDSFNPRLSKRCHQLGVSRKIYAQSSGFSDRSLNQPTPFILYIILE